MIQKPSLTRFWVRCPYCGAKVCVYDNTANCNNVFLKCTRGCKSIFELLIVNGKQSKS